MKLRRDKLVAVTSAANVEDNFALGCGTKAQPLRHVLLSRKVIGDVNGKNGHPLWLPSLAASFVAVAGPSLVVNNAAWVAHRFSDYDVSPSRMLSASNRHAADDADKQADTHTGDCALHVRRRRHCGRCCWRAWPQAGDEHVCAGPQS